MYVLYVSVQQEIAVCGEKAVRFYEESTPEGDWTEEGLVAAMRASINKRIKAFRIKLGKLTTVANCNLGLEWLQEVRFNLSKYLHLIYCLFIHLNES